MNKNRKHLVRFSALVENLIKTKDGLSEWESNGYVDFETELDMMFLMEADEEVLIKVLSNIIQKSNTKVLRYIYQNYELVYHFPIKIQAPIQLLYKRQYKIEINNITKQLNKKKIKNDNYTRRKKVL